MFNELKVNNIVLPKPDGDLEFSSEKLKTEYETEAGTTQVSVRRESKLTIKGTWTVTGTWAERFRSWAADDTVTVEAFFPSKSALTEHECQLVISSEKHIRDARAQLNRGGLYQLSVTMEEL